MTTVTISPFDIKTATALVAPYDGSADNLESFIDSINLLSELTTAAHMPVAVKFVKTRLNGKARLTLPAEVKTLAEIAKAVKENCSSKETPEQVIAKLKSIKNGLPKQQYCQEVENLCDKLTNTYVRENIPHATAKKK